MIKILLVTQQNETGLTFHRQTTPHNHLMRNYEYQVDKTFDLTDATIEDLKQYQIVSFLRIVDYKFRTEEIIKKCKDAGCVVVIDIDDSWLLNPTHELYQIYKENKIPEQTIEGLKLADYVTCTTEHFADKIKQYNSNVLVLPNSIDTTVEQFKSKPYYSDRVRFGWIGGIFHIPDVRMMYEGFKEVFKTVHSDKFQFCLGGFGANEQYKFLEVIYTDNYKNIKSDIYKKYLLNYNPEGNECAEYQTYKRLWGTTVFEYAKLYNEIDVALVPLVSNSFNSCKSQIKILEAGFFKKAVIVSNVLPYTIDCNKSNSVLINPDKRNSGWGTAMKVLIHNPERVKDLGEEMYLTVKDKYDMDTVNKVRHEIYQAICIMEKV